MSSREAVWNPAPEHLRLGNDEVHVWRASLNQPTATIAVFKQILAPDELARAARFHFQKDRDHFIVARALLRIILGRYLGILPEQLRFCFNDYGKPALAVAEDSETVRFNLSHSRELVLIAFARNRELGIDLEYVRDDSDTAQIAKQFFSPREVEALGALPPGLRAEGFFRCWTRKEAYIKARGQGLSLPLDQFDVSLAPDEPAELLSVASDPEEVSRWSLRELAPGNGYLAAIAVEGSGWQLNCFQWPDVKSPEGATV